MTMSEFAKAYDAHSNAIKILVELLAETTAEKDKKQIKKKIKEIYIKLDDLIDNVLIDIK